MNKIMETNPDADYPVIKNGTIALKVKNDYLVIPVEKFVFYKADDSYPTKSNSHGQYQNRVSIY